MIRARVTRIIRVLFFLWVIVSVALAVTTIITVPLPDVTHRSERAASTGAWLLRLRSTLLTVQRRGVRCDAEFQGLLLRRSLVPALPLLWASEKPSC
jgi:hypothetical protein